MAVEILAGVLEGPFGLVDSTLPKDIELAEGPLLMVFIRESSAVEFTKGALLAKSAVELEFELDELPEDEESDKPDAADPLDAWDPFGAPPEDPFAKVVLEGVVKKVALA